MMKNIILCFISFNFEKKRVGELQLPRNLRLGHCDWGSKENEEVFANIFALSSEFPLDVFVWYQSENATPARDRLVNCILINLDADIVQRLHVNYNFNYISAPRFSSSVTCDTQQSV